MFTEGLDESAISWIKQGSNVEESDRRLPPLNEKFDQKYTIPTPRSPLASISSGSHALPPLKFHSGLLGPRNPVSLSLGSSNEEDYYNDESDAADSESMASVNGEAEDNCSDEELINKSILDGFDVTMFDVKKTGNLNQVRGTRSTGFRHTCVLNRGLSKENLQIEVPGNPTRRFTDSESPYSAYATPIGISAKLSHAAMDLGTPSAPPIIDVGKEELNTENTDADADADAAAAASVSDENQPGVSSGERFDLKENEEEENMSMESAPHEFCKRPWEENGGAALEREEEEAADVWQEEKSMDISPCHVAGSDHSAWQTLIAYDACVRLCLNAWARSCTEAPEFLKDECLVLRRAFSLHKYLLQPRGGSGGGDGVVQASKSSTRTTIAQTVPHLRERKITGKIRVEVKKLRIIPRRKLKSTNSMRGVIYMQAGAEYVRHISLLVKSGITSLKLASFSLTSEDVTPHTLLLYIPLLENFVEEINKMLVLVPLAESLSCLLLLKSTSEDNQLQMDSAVCLQPGSGDYHDFFPENEGDSILLEVQDTKKNVQGRATIPVSMMTDHPTDKSKWWPLYLGNHECVGKVQLCITCSYTQDETTHSKNGVVVETLAYDLLLEASMRAQHFQARHLQLNGRWKWLLEEFAEYYGVSDSYARLRYLSYVMNVATPTKDCIELVYELLMPVLKARNDKSLTRQEKSMLLSCEAQVASLLADVFQNYKSLDELSPTGLVDMSGPIPETAAPALAPAVKVYTLLHDILTQDAQTILRNYLETAAFKRCRKLMLDTDEFLSSNSDSTVIDTTTTMATAYLKMKNICSNLGIEIQADLKIHDQHILPSSIDLASITGTVYSTELFKRLRCFLSAWPPSGPTPHVTELLKATADFERDLESWMISTIGFDSRELFHNYIMVWIQDLQLNLLEICKAEKVPWSGVITNYSTSPFAEEAFDKLVTMLHGYAVVVNRWPQYTLVLENAGANVERAIIKALERQYNDILTPLKNSVPKKLGMQVQKLARRQSTALYSVPPQLGTFLNTIKRMLDVLHCRVEDILKAWASYLPFNVEKKYSFGEQINGVTVLLKTKYKNYMQAIVVKLANNIQASRNTRFQRILEETKITDGEAQIRERMQMLNTQLSDSISNLHEVFTSRTFVAICRGFWDKMGQIVVKFLEGRKENRVWYNGSYHALGILDDIFASQMQRLQGNALLEKDVEPPRSITEARSILCRDTTNGVDSSTYLYF